MMILVEWWMVGQCMVFFVDMFGGRDGDCLFETC